MASQYPPRTPFHDPRLARSVTTTARDIQARLWAALPPEMTQGHDPDSLYAAMMQEAR